MSGVRRLSPTAVRIFWGPFSFVIANACLSVPMGVIGGRDAAMWHVRFGLSGPLFSAILYGQSLDPYDTVGTAVAVALWAAFAIWPTRALACVLLAYAMLWNLFGWVVAGV